MASLLQKLVRKPSATPTILSNLNKQFLTPPVLTHLSGCQAPSFTTNDPNTDLGPSPKSRDSKPSHFLNFYPCFSFGQFLNPISPTGFVQFKTAETVSDDSSTIWADSVKKKRKKKMNKHKLKKLRKRLRGKS